MKQILSGPIEIIERERLPEHKAPFKTEVFMSDVPAGRAVELVNEDKGFMVVDANTSVIFVAPRISEGKYGFSFYIYLFY